MHSLFEYFSEIYSFFFCTSHDITYQRTTIRSHTTAAGWLFVFVCKHNATPLLSFAFIVHLVLAGRAGMHIASPISHLAAAAVHLKWISEMSIPHSIHWGHICMCTFDGAWPRICCCLRSCTSVSVFNSADLCQPTYANRRNKWKRCHKNQLRVLRLTVRRARVLIASDIY